MTKTEALDYAIQSVAKEADRISKKDYEARKTINEVIELLTIIQENITN